jgi:hypothetical protein
MKSKTPHSITNFLYWLGVIVFSASIFFLLLTIGFPQGYIKYFSCFKLVHFIGFAAIFFLIFQIKGKLSYLLGGFFTAVVFAIPVAVRLSTGLSNATILGGFVPYKDGFYYYNAANLLLAGQPIPLNGLQGVFRPLFPGLLSVLLLVTNQNLLLVLEMLVLLVACTTYFAAVTINDEYGPLPAAIFFSFVYAFIRPMLGDTLTELPSLAFACLSLVLLLRTAQSRKTKLAVAGSIMLVLAISIRAGAFIMLPFLILWLAWHFNGGTKISFRKLLIFALILLAAFAVFNMVLPRLITEQGDSTFGNFSWMLYGQAVGGAGFDYHLQTLGTSDSGVVLQAALDKIREYPIGLLIGSYKSYRDFFTKNNLGMFDLLSGESAAFQWIFWLLNIVLLITGLIRSARTWKEPRSGLLLACFAGLLLSIPFLPPIDGGNRFYSGSVPFLFALMVSGLPEGRIMISKIVKENSSSWIPEFSYWFSWASILTLIVSPVLILNLASPQPFKETPCKENQVSVNLRIEQGSFIDILPNGYLACGLAPKLCQETFSSNGVDQANDDFYNRLVDLSGESEIGFRFWAGVEWNSRQYYYFILPLNLAENISAGQAFVGCAEEINTHYQKALKVVSVK